MTGGKSLKKTIHKYYHYYILLFLPVLYFIIFKYGAMFGNIIAFRKYVPGKSIYGEAWVGLRYFKMFMSDSYFWRAFFNTLILSFSNLAITFPIPIIFAILLNEINKKRFKSFVQTVSYLPHFISTVVVVGIIKELLSPSTGIINTFLVNLNLEPVYFLNETKWFRPIYILSEIWQTTGWSSIIYIAALSNIDQQLYEAAEIDGAGRLKQVLHITVPSLLPTIMIILILSIGRILSVGYEKILLLYNPITKSVAEVISTFVYSMGLESSNYSYAAAIGLFDSIIGLLMVYGANYFSKKLTDSGLW